MSAQKVGLVLTSGGARGAYQAGALRAIAEFTGSAPFVIYSGVSAGSINAAYLASRSGTFQTAANGLAQVWERLTPDQIFRTDSLTLARTSLAWLSDLGLGGWLGGGHGRSLLDTRPLHALLNQILDFPSIERSLASGLLQGLALTTTSYQTGSAVTFFEGAGDSSPWVRSTRIAVRARLGLEHVLASSAIPLFFPAVRIGDAYFGDGCIRMTTPLSPAIHLGAERILAIGVRHERSLGAGLPPSDAKAPAPSPASRSRYPYLAEVVGVILNAMFLDALESDIERMERINLTLSLIPEDRLGAHPSGLRPIPILALKPSRDLGLLVAEVLKDFSFPIRYLLRGIGASKESGWDLLSYLAFDSAYTSRLVELGYNDALSARETLGAFLKG